MGVVLGMVACVGAGALVSRAATGPAVASRPPAAPVIATVDLEEILRGLKEREDKEKALAAKTEEYKQKVAALQEELKSDKAKFEAETEGPAKVALGKAMREKLFSGRV